MKKRFLVFGGTSGAIAVMLGAMGAHFLKSKLDTGLITETNLQTFETAVKYQMYHAIILVLLALLTEKVSNKALTKSGHCFMLGTVLFSGSLYLLSTAKLIGISSLMWLGPITPIGGVFLIAGWALLAFGGIKKS
jgi:uncharacterized membrane protein YgdD (TMEM256/DUF423 family)